MASENLTSNEPLNIKANPFAIISSVLIGFCLVALLPVKLYVYHQHSEIKSKSHVDSKIETHSIPQIEGQSQPKHANALTINLPLRLFGTDDALNWRTRAVYGPRLAGAHGQDKSWRALSHAQSAEDLWLYDNWFYGMKNGVIMESGALDGLQYSTSYMFENIANWTSVHVEADPINYGKLIQNRLNAININCALCSEPRLLHYTNEDNNPAVRGFVELMPPAFLNSWHPKISSGEVKIADLPAVQCVTAKSLMRELHLRHIDIWILDVEGAEESVLRGTDFSKVRINAIAMECDEHDTTKNKRKTDIIEANGFECILVQRNCMCRNLLHKISAAP